MKSSKFTFMYGGGNRNDANANTQVGFICTQLLNKLSLKVPVAQVLRTIEILSNREILAPFIQKLYAYEPNMCI